MNQYQTQRRLRNSEAHPKWLNSVITFHESTLSGIGRFLPAFERRSFAITQPGEARTRINERLDTIVRKPTKEDPNFVPAGVVSRDYSLVPHTEVLAVATQALESIHLSPTEIKAG